MKRHSRFFIGFAALLGLAAGSALGADTNGDVTIPPAKNWPTTKESATKQSTEPPALSWLQTDTSLALNNGNKTVWRLVYDAKQPKTYFHPLATVDGEVLTAFEPADHPWHRGLWWSWKFINGLNYWEENRKTHASDGVNELTRATVKPGKDFSAQAELSFSYHPPGQPAVMTEVRHLSIGRPNAAGQYVIDWTSEFTVGDAPVNLGRTPLANEQGGKDYGGYAGFSARFVSQPNGWSIRTSEGKTSVADAHGKGARWLDFSSPGGGIAVFDHHNNLRHPSPWYAHDKSPMSFFSPSFLFNEPLVLDAGKSLKLSYRVIVHSKPVTAEQLETEWRAFSAPTKP